MLQWLLRQPLRLICRQFWQQPMSSRTWLLIATPMHLKSILRFNTSVLAAKTVLWPGHQSKDDWIVLGVSTVMVRRHHQLHLTTLSATGCRHHGPVNLVLAPLILRRGVSLATRSTKLSWNNSLTIALTSYSSPLSNCDPSHQPSRF